MTLHPVDNIDGIMNLADGAKPGEHGGWAALPFGMGISNIGLMPVLMIAG